jgi:hypothetical protein
MEFRPRRGSAQDARVFEAHRVQPRAEFPLIDLLIVPEKDDIRPEIVENREPIAARIAEHGTIHQRLARDGGAAFLFTNVGPTLLDAFGRRVARDNHNELVAMFPRLPKVLAVALVNAIKRSCSKDARHGRQTPLAGSPDG